jgi:hypothetical protein
MRNAQIGDGDTQVLLRNARKQLSAENGDHPAAEDSKAMSDGSSALSGGEAALAGAGVLEQQATPVRRDPDMQLYHEVIF